MKKFWGDGDLAEDEALAEDAEKKRKQLLLQSPDVVASRNRDNVKAALELADSVAKAETDRETNLNARGAAVAVVAGLIVSVATAIAKPVFGDPSNLTETTRNVAGCVFLIALVFVSSALVMAVVGVLRPGRGGRTKIAVGAAVVNVWSQDRGDIALTAAVDRRVEVFWLDRLLRAIPTLHYRNRSKARWLRRAWMFLMLGIILIGSAGVIILAEQRPPAKGESGQPDITWDEILVVIAGALVLVWLLIRFDLVSALPRRVGQEERARAQREAEAIVDLLVPSEEPVALREAILRYQDKVARRSANSSTAGLMRRMRRPHRSGLALHWLSLAGERVVPPSGPPGTAASEERAVALYRQRSGKDPLTARVEVGRMVLQLGPLNDPVGWAGPRCGVPPVTGAELQAAADALIAYYLADRRTDDKLLGNVLAVWAEWEELLEQARRRSFGGVPRNRRAARAAEDEVQDCTERYVAAWRRWLGPQAEPGAPAAS